MNREIRRHTDVVGIFPKRDAILRLVGDALAQLRDEWAECLRYLGPDTLTKSQSVGTNQPEEVTPDLHAQSRLTPIGASTQKALTRLADLSSHIRLRAHFPRIANDTNGVDLPSG